ncbi:hypothetical protein KY285_020328 [Solanum tuberosum]|nr:hypothetical protein KY285_020328 [Solanum tuberosum]
MEPFQDPSELEHFRIKLVYARCSEVERLELWEELGSIAEDCHHPWMVGGDFNVILKEEDKTRGGWLLLNKKQWTLHSVYIIVLCLKFLSLGENTLGGMDVLKKVVY